MYFPGKIIICRCCAKHTVTTFFRSPFYVRSCQYLNFSVSHQDLKKPGSQLFYKISQLFQKQDLNSVSHAQPVSQARISRKDNISQTQYLTVPVSHRPSISRSQYLTVQYLTVSVSHGSSISRSQYLTGTDSSECISQ